MITTNIEILCHKKGITVSGLERNLGVGNSTIAKWSKSSPTVEKLAAVADYFGVTVDELLQTDNQSEGK